jgi:phosphonopyruvate decarboxylase
VIAPAQFVEPLIRRGWRQFTGVPCSFFRAAIDYVIDRPDLRYFTAPNEGSALAMAAGAGMAGKKTALLIQNSGFGNLVNPLTSLNMIYRIPVLVFMSGRAYGVADEPQHEVIGRTMGRLLDALEIPREDLPAEAPAYEAALDRAERAMREGGKPFFFLVPKDAIEEYSPARGRATAYPMKRIDAIRRIAGALEGRACVIATTGKPSRELFCVDDRQSHFYMQGSMGHAPSIALGVALAKPAAKVVVLDGDGALLMHLGALSSVGHYAPPNFYHIVLDNESYETTGDQDTVSPTVDFAAAARACGYRHAEQVDGPDVLDKAVRAMVERPGPALVRVKINREPTKGIARISSKYDSPAIACRFAEALARHA